MKKYHSFGKSAMTALFVTLLVGATLGCSEASPDKPSLQSIAITSPPTKTVYTVGEALDISGIKVMGTYSGGMTKTETVNLSNISGYNKDATGEQTITVTVSGKTATFTVTVNAINSGAVLQSIAITSPPTKTAYVRGDELDLSGLVVTETYDDETTKPETVGIADISGYDATAVGEQTLTVTIGNKTATFAVTVSEPPLGLDDLSSAEGGDTAADPVSVALSDSFTNDVWESALSAIAEAGKYVSLDLSACAMPDIEFDPGAATEGADKITALILPTTAKSIKAGTASNPTFSAFTNLTSIRGVGIETIGDWAFRGCTSLVMVSLPVAADIGRVAFGDCLNLTTIMVDPVNTAFAAHDGMLLNKAGTTLIAYPSATGDIILPAVIEVGAGAFYGCTTLTAVSLPAATTISDAAFINCTSLTSLSLPAAETIGYSAFSTCESLETVSLPAATSIGGYAFWNCNSLTTVSLPATPPSLGSRIFTVTYADTITILVPTGAVSAYTSAWGVDANTPANGNQDVYGANHKAVTITDAAQ
jgi:hypothetical protein